MPPNRPLPIIALVLRVLIGGWFVYSGGEKVFGTGLTEFTRAVGNYRLVGAPWDALVAYTLPWFEIVAGLCLMLGIWKKGALVIMTGLVIVFSIGIGYAWSQGLNIACGCRGDGAPMNYWLKALEMAGYFVGLGLIGWVEWREGKSGKR